MFEIVFLAPGFLCPLAERFMAIREGLVTEIKPDQCCHEAHNQRELHGVRHAPTPELSQRVGERLRWRGAYAGWEQGRSFRRL
jgi:hypothetical protein